MDGFIRQQEAANIKSVPADDVMNPNLPRLLGGDTKRPIYAWTDLTYLLHKHHVSWRYYMFNGTEPLCESNATQSCAPVTGGPRSASIWYPLKWFDTVRDDHQAGTPRKPLILPVHAKTDLIKGGDPAWLPMSSPGWG